MPVLHLILAAAGLFAAAFSPYTHAQRLVEVDTGRRMNLYCTGAGSPTVVMDAAIGSSMVVWRKVQPEIAQHVRVCSYDRAGYGFSDPAATARTTSANVDDLHALLHTAGIAPPYVLVAHSLSAFDARMYADRYRADVAGMVLIDPSDENEEQFSAIYGKKKFDAQSAADTKFILDCDRKARRHLLKPGDDCVGPTDSSAPEAFNRVEQQHTTSAGMWDAVASEEINIPNDVTEIRREQRSYGNLPLVILAAGTVEQEAKANGATDAQAAAEKRLWQKLHGEEAALSNLGVVCTVPGASHYIQLVQPLAVVNAVLEVVRESANEQRPSCEAPAITQLYQSAVEAMSNLPQPQFMTYTLQAQSQGLQVDLVRQSGAVWLNVHGGSAPANWSLEHRTYDYTSEILDEATQQRYVTQRSFFDPTWHGAYRALHEGMFGSQDQAPPRPQNAATPQPGTTLKTIALASVMGPGIYTITDRGETACSNGDPGRALHLTSRERNPAHQLTDAVIDLSSTRFCMMRFAETSGFGFHGYLEQHYADVNGYWLQTDGFLDGTIRIFGISTHHGIWRYRLTGMNFSASPLAAAPARK